MKVLGGGWQHSEKLKMMANNNAQIPTNVYISHFVSKKKKKTLLYLQVLSPS